MKAIRLLCSLILALVGLSASAGEVVLAPGEALMARHLDQLVAQRLPALAAGERYELSWAAPRLPLPNPATAPIQLRLERLVHLQPTGAVEGEVSASLPSGERTVLRIIGTARRLVQLPVLRQPVPRGTEVVPEMLTTAWFPPDGLPAEVLTDADAVIGREAVRRLPAGRPLTTADLAEPRLVRRGESVTVVYRAPGLEVTGLARALEDGAQGETVRLMNPDTRRPLRGVVVARRRVEVGAWP